MNKEELRNLIKTELGYPYQKIQVSDAQFDRQIDIALKKFHDFQSRRPYQKDLSSRCQHNR
jgi:hypothetical protein